MEKEKAAKVGIQLLLYFAVLKFKQRYDGNKMCFVRMDLVIIPARCSITTAAFASLHSFQVTVTQRAGHAYNIVSSLSDRELRSFDGIVAVVCQVISYVTQQHFFLLCSIHLMSGFRNATVI